MIVRIICMFVCCMQLLCLLPSLASQKPVLSMNSTRASKYQKPSYFQRVHYKFLCMVFQAIPSKFSCATFQKPSNTSHFVPLFLAHEDVVDGFVIFHTKLSTPRLGSFICSSLILQGSWSDHYNLKRKRKQTQRKAQRVKIKTGNQHPKRRKKLQRKTDYSGNE